MLATYTLAGATLVYDGGLGNAPKPAEEIPVEIIVEPPPPPPPPPPQPTPSPEARAPQPPLDLSPAYDAPRAGTAETDNGDKAKDSKPPPAPAVEDKSAERASGAEAQAEAPKPEASAMPAPAPEAPPPAPAPPLKLSEGEMPPPPAQPEPQPTPSPTPQPQTSQAPSPAPPAPAAGKSAPLFASVPDVDFGGDAMKSPVSGGNARATYTAILLAAILPHFHKPGGGRSTLGGKPGVVNFSIDEQGRLLNRYIAEESGLPELDRAAIDAVGAASPFPPPPRGLGRGTFSWFFGKL